MGSGEWNYALSFLSRVIIKSRHVHRVNILAEFLVEPAATFAFILHRDHLYVAANACQLTSTRNENLYPSVIARAKNDRPSKDYSAFDWREKVDIFSTKLYFAHPVSSTVPPLTPFPPFFFFPFLPRIRGFTNLSRA